ncbi:MAG TPA: TRAP transporter substrate-binding protein DctP [Vicinamibacterales bacterium]|nr:TRAP transporter substrate-binding protein DctP [Vicinamibacterales bacterium]
MSWRARLILVALAALALSRAPLAQSAAIKLATVVPDGSIWDKSLKQMGADWKAATGDRVSLTIFSGGSQGDESTVLRKMRLNALQGASLTVAGLASIDWSFNVFNIPFFFQSYDELNAVIDRLTPLLKQRVEAKGFVLVHWGHGGWLQVFSRQPVQSVADLKKARLYTSAGDDTMTQWYKANGFQPRAMAMTDVLTGLTTGMIDALPTTPIAAVSFQWFKQTPYMLDLGISPIVGATVVTKKTWDAIPAADRAKMTEISLKVEKQLQADVPKQDGLATLLMQNQGLKITKGTGPEWQQLANNLGQTMRGKMIPPDVYDLALKERDAFRQRQAAAPKPAAAATPGASPAKAPAQPR